MNKFLVKFLKIVDKIFPSFVSKFFNKLCVEDLVLLLKENLDNLDFIIYKLSSDNLDSLLEINQYDLKLLCCELKNKSIFLYNDVFRNNIGMCINHLVSYLSGDELLKLIDENLLEKIFSSDKSSLKMPIDEYLFIRALFSLNNYEKNRVLENHRCLSYIDKNVSSYYNSIICCLDEDFILNVIDYCLRHRTNKLLFLICSVDDYLISSVIFNNYEKIISLKPDGNFLFMLPFNVINKLIENKIFLDIYMNNLDKLSDLFYNGYVFPDFLLNSDEIINYYASLGDSLYLNCLNNLFKNNTSFALDVEKRRKQKILKNVSDTHYLDGVFSQVIFTFFHDSVYNLKVNICNMVNYIYSNDVLLVSTENLRLYRNIIFFDMLSDEEKKNFLSSFNVDIDYGAVFYDDYTSVKRHSYMSIKNSLLKLDKNSKLYNSSKSKKYGVDVYELNGEPFYSIVHCTDYDCGDKSKVNWKLHDTIALSLIGAENIAVFRPDAIKFGFFDFNIDNVIHVSYTDSYTTGLKGTGKIQSILSSKQLLKGSIGYTEILYKERSLIKPDFIVCYDEPFEGDIYNAKKFNIPILIINTKKYEMKTGIEGLDSFYNDNNYVFDEQNVSLCEEAIEGLNRVR